MTDLIWKNAWALWLLWLLPILAVLSVLAYRGRVRAAKSFLGDVMVKKLAPPITAGRAFLRGALLVTGVGLVILALAGPAWDFFYVTTKARGVDAIILLDVSRSMLALDGDETRLSRAKAAIEELVMELPGDRVGLIPFAGESLVACPLTYDRAFFLESLRRANPDSVGRGGTKLGPALDRAGDLLDAESGRDRVIVVVTDAGDQKSLPKDVAKRWAKKGIRLLAVGVGRSGDNDQAPLVIGGKVVRDKDGKAVPAKVNMALLRTLAEVSKGVAVPPAEAHRLAQVYRDYVDPLEKGEAREMQEKHYREQYQWFLLPGILLLLIHFALRPFGAKPSGTQGGPGFAGALVLFGLMGLSACGNETERDAVAAATQALEAGNAAEAVTTLKELAEEREEDAILSYDLGCALHAKGDLEAARKAYGEVMSRGTRDLRARAQVNLAAIDTHELMELVGTDYTSVGEEVRSDIRQRAESILDRLFRARSLDRSLGEAVERQDAVARWLRVAEDEWATRDRAEARNKLHNLKGVLYLRGLMNQQKDLVRKAVSGSELTQSLALSMTELAADTAKVEEKIGDGLPPLKDPLKKQVLDYVDAAKPLMESIAQSLGEAELEQATRTSLASLSELHKAYALWAEPGDVVASLGASQKSIAQELIARLSKGEKLADSKLKEVAVQQQQAGVEALALLLERLKDKDAEKSWSVHWNGRAVTELDKAYWSLKSFEDELSQGLKPAAATAMTASKAFQLIGEEWQWSKLKPGPLAQALQERERSLRAAAMLSQPLDLTTPTQAQVGSELAALRAQLDYLDEAFKRLVQEGASEDPTEEENKAIEARLQMLMDQKTIIVDHHERAQTAWKAAASPPVPEAEAALAAAANALRMLWLGLSTFEETLTSSIDLQKAMVGLSEQVIKAAGDDDTLFPQELRSGPASLPELATSQGDTAQMVGIVSMRLAAERARIEKKGDSGAAPSPVPDPKGEPEATAGEALAKPQSLEDKALLQAFEDMKPLIAEAAVSARAAADELKPEKAPSVVSELKSVVQMGLKLERQALERLSEAQKIYNEARMSAGQIAQVVMKGDTQLLMLARELAAKRSVPLSVVDPNAPLPKAGEEPISARAEDLAKAMELSIDPFVDRLAGALERDLEKMDKQASGAGAPPGQAPPPKSEEQKKQEAQAREMMKALAEQVKLSQGQASVELKADRVEAGAAALDRTRDLARQLWLPFADLQGVLKQGIEEETELLQRTVQFLQSENDESKAPKDRVAASVTDQGRTRELIPVITRLVEAQAQKSQAGGAPGAPGGGGGQGLSKEVVELAKKNLPLAEAAMTAAETRLPNREWSLVRAEQDKAKRLLEEILKKLQDEQQDQNQQEQQPQPQPEQNPDEKPSEQERDRQKRSAEERSRKMEEKSKKMRKRAPVQEDW